MRKPRLIILTRKYLVLLQTTEAEMCGIEEKYCKKVRILLDSGSQKSCDAKNCGRVKFETHW